MRTQRSADIVSGIALAGLGLVIAVASIQITSTMGERLPPRTLPLTMGLIMVVTGLLLSFRSMRSTAAEIEISWPAREGWMNILVTFLSLVAFYLLIEPIGMPLATLAFLTFLIWYLDRKFVRALVIGVITAAIVLFVFIRALTLTLPAGPLNW